MAEPYAQLLVSCKDATAPDIDLWAPLCAGWCVPHQPSPHQGLVVYAVSGDVERRMTQRGNTGTMPSPRITFGFHIQTARSCCCLVTPRQSGSHFSRSGGMTQAFEVAVARWTRTWSRAWRQPSGVRWGIGSTGCTGAMTRGLGSFSPCSVWRQLRVSPT